MATTPQEKATFMNNNTPLPPLHDHEQEEDGIDDFEDTVSPSGCACFQLFSFKWQRNNGNEHRHLLPHQGEYRESWLVNKMKKVKEISESLAGPKFKTFIRKISGYCKNKKQKNRFQYDAHSYALNFDGGVDREDDGSLLDFSARFAAPSIR